MCSIIAGFSKEEILNLAKLNEYRGTHSHSLTVIDRDTYKVVSVERSFGAINYETFTLPEGNFFYIIHQQAPTTENKDEFSIHPAELSGQYLYHNGIVKSHEVERLRGYLHSTFTWDTKLILKQLIVFGDPSNIDGSFACVYLHSNGIWVFRNEISPLYFNERVISSTRFEESFSVPTNRIYNLKFNNDDTFRLIPEEISFNTVENPYYFGE